MTIGLVTTPGKRYDEIKWTGSTYETIRASCFDGQARLEDMDVDGVDAEFLYPSQRTMWSFMAHPDEEFHVAGVRAYNDWLFDEFCAHDPERLIALAQMPSLGVGAPVQVWPQTRAGVRAQLGVGWYVVTLLLSVDVYPARGAEPRLLRGGIMAQLSM